HFWQPNLSFGDIDRVIEERSRFTVRVGTLATKIPPLEWTMLIALRKPSHLGSCRRHPADDGLGASAHEQQVIVRNGISRFCRSARWVRSDDHRPQQVAPKRVSEDEAQLTVLFIIDRCDEHAGFC